MVRKIEALFAHRLFLVIYTGISVPSTRIAQEDFLEHTKGRSNIRHTAVIFGILVMHQYAKYGKSRYRISLLRG